MPEEGQVQGVLRSGHRSGRVCHALVGGVWVFALCSTPCGTPLRSVPSLGVYVPAAAAVCRALGDCQGGCRVPASATNTSRVAIDVCTADGRAGGALVPAVQEASCRTDADCAAAGAGAWCSLNFAAPPVSSAINKQCAHWCSNRWHKVLLLMLWPCGCVAVLVS
jgi:hypothetical protein